MVKTSISVAAVVGLIGVSLGGLVSYHQITSQKPDYYTVGETAAISLPEMGLTYLSRIDTGARTTSLHAKDIVVDGSSAENVDQQVNDEGLSSKGNVSDDSTEDVDKKSHIGRNIQFRTMNELNQQATYSAKVVDVSSVRNAQGVEDRYVVELDLEWQGLNKRVKVNLRDRSAMTYKLLIGRNWLAGDVLVDVAQSEGVIND
jgi:hypothetical protein